MEFKTGRQKADSESKEDRFTSYRERSKMRRRQWKRKKRMRLFLLLMLAGWLLVALQTIAAALFQKNNNIVTAFSTVKPGQQEAVLEITARYPTELPAVEEKQKLLQAIAQEIGLEITQEPVCTETTARQEITYEKTAAAADTTLRFIGLKKEAEGGQREENYIYARLRLKHSVRAVSSYKELLESITQQLGCTEISTTIQLIGTYEGYLTLDRRNRIANEILAELGGKIAYEYREDDLYTIYAYTGLLEDYISVEGKKINLHIAMSKDEKNYRTIVYLASPILPDTW